MGCLSGCRVFSTSVQKLFYGSCSAYKWPFDEFVGNKVSPNTVPPPATGGDGTPVELFQILEDDAVKVLHSICQQIWKTQQWPQDWKMSIFIPVPKKCNAKECSNYYTIELILHASEVMLKILQARLQQYVNHELQMFKLDLEKAGQPEIKLPISQKKQQNFTKTFTFVLSITLKPLTVWTTTNCGKFKRWEYQTTWPASERSVCRARSNS